jgi:hypothetical protein
LIYDRKCTEEANLDQLIGEYETEKSENVKENDIDEKFSYENYEQRRTQRLIGTTNVRPSIIMKKPHNTVIDDMVDGNSADEAKSIKI